MPVITVNWIAGKSKEQKVKLAEAMTQAMVDIGVPREATWVIFHEEPRENWAMGGKLASER